VKPAILFIGGGPLQEPACRTARALGAEVLLIDRERAPHCGSLAAEHVMLDGTDVPGIVGAAEQLARRYRIACSHANNEFSLPAAAACNELLELPGPRSAAVTRCAYKPLMRRLLARHGVAIPVGAADLSRAAERRPGDLPRRLPFVVKAAQGAGSVGVARIESVEDWQAYCQTLHGDVSLVLEDLLVGSHHDVQGAMIRGELRGVSIADRLFGPSVLRPREGVEISPCLPVRGVYPSGLAACARAAIARLTERAAHALGIDDSPIKADVVWTSSGPVIIEVGPRFHGEIVSAFLVPAASGEDPIGDWFRYALRGVWSWTPPRVARTSVWTAILPERHCRVRSEARSEAEAHPDVRALVWRFGRSTGDGRYLDNRAVRGLVVTAAGAREPALRAADRVLANIHSVLGEPDEADAPPRHATTHFYDALYARTLERYPAEAVVSFVERNLAALRAAPVLDLGCGAGRHLRLLAQRSVRALGLDPARRGLVEARREIGELGELGKPGQGGLVCGRAAHLPFADAVFGGLLAWESLFYGSATDLVRAVEEALRVLRPGAPFLMSFKSREDYRVRDYPEVQSGVHEVEGGQWMAFVCDDDLEALLGPRCESLAIETLARSHDNGRKLRVNLIATGVLRAKEES